jgi:UDP-N-acetylmuramoyl-tripeptide--D-alanyl-D-alanine ligase
MVLLDDSYSSSPDALASMIDHLDGSTFSIVVGDMLELGKYSESFHTAIGHRLASSSCVRIYAVGDYAKVITKAAVKKGFPEESTYIYGASDEELESLARKVYADRKKNGTLLIKGSHKLRLDSLTTLIIAEDKNTKKDH